MSWLSTLWNGVKGAWKGIMGASDVVGPLIGAGSSYLISDRDNQASAESAERQQAANLAAQREFAQNGLRWKVEDAKQAGLHPLFAIGGSGAAYANQPIHVGAGHDASGIGQNLARASSAMLSADERNMRALQLQAAQASIAKDEAQAMFYASEAARNRQQSAGTVIPQGLSMADYQPGDIINPTGSISRPIKPPSLSVGDNPTVYRSLASSISKDVPSWQEYKDPREGTDTHTNKGVAQAAWTTFNLRPGLKIDLPAGGSMSESLESVTENNIVLATVVAFNVERYGKSWLSRMARIDPAFKPFLSLYFQ